MRVLLVIVIIWNVIDALGVLISTLADNESFSFAALGSSMDKAILPVSMAIVATAILQIYPYKNETSSFE